MPKHACMVVVFPLIERFVEKFLSSLEGQTFKDFDLIVVQDGLERFDQYARRCPALSIKMVEGGGTPASNRRRGIDYAAAQGYNMVSFCDADDYYAPNRMETVAALAGKWDIVVEDFDLVDECGNVLKENYLSSRLGHHRELTQDFLVDKNVIGFGNTTMSLAHAAAPMSEKVIALDWFFFFNALRRGAKAVFTGGTKMSHRLYAENTLGMDRLTDAQIVSGVRGKQAHYREMAVLDERFVALSRRFEALAEKLNADERFRCAYVARVRSRNLVNPFWFEEITAE